MEFYAPVGWYDGERLSKSRVSVSVHMHFQIDQTRAITDLSMVPNYEMVHQIAKKILEQPIALIEEATRLIFVQIEASFHSYCQELEVTLTKWNPSMGKTESTSYTLSKS